MRKRSCCLKLSWAGALVLAACAGSPRATRAAEPEAAEQAQAAENQQDAQRREQLKQMTNHWEQQLVKVFYAQLELIRSRCGDLPVETRRAIGQAGQRAVKEAAVEAAQAQVGGNQARRNRAAIRAARQPAKAEPRKPAEPNPKPEDPQTQGDPLDRLTTALEKVVAERVGAAEAAAFAADAAAQRERRKKATVDMCVAMLDGQLFLTAAQREAIGRSLLEHWQDGMLVTLQQVHFNNGRMMFHGVPGDCVVPHLDEAQRQAFGTPGNVNVGGGVAPTLQMLGRLNHQLARDPWWFP